MREERTEVFLMILGALFAFFIEILLFAFFYGDADDLYCGSIAVARVTRRYGHQYIESFHNLTENTVLVIQMRRRTMCDKELRAIRSRSGICHGQNTLFVMLQAGMKLVTEFVTGSTGAGAGGVATLYHEVGDHTMKDDAIIKSFA